MFRFPTPRIFSAVALAGILASSFPAAAQVFFPNFPDACTSQLTPGEVTVDNLPSTIVISTAASLPGKKVVMIANGNGFWNFNYAPLGEHLARNGFIVGLFQRPALDSENPAFFLDALVAVLAHIGTSSRDPDLEVALVGHSMGGRVAIDAAGMNRDLALGFPVAAVATLAPVASESTWLDGWDVPAMLTIYGSQDEDTDAYETNVPGEAFYAYDTSGTENTTTCNAPPCVATTPPFQKTMVYVYGADHPALIGIEDSGSAYPQYLNYLTPGDTLCITKAYLTGFLRWNLWGDSVYKGMLRGLWQPISVASIATAEADGFGNPPGSPLRLFLQNSPVQHRTVQNFSAGLGTYTKSAGAVLQHNPAGSLATSPYRIRHFTGLALLGWNAPAASQWVRFATPSGSRDASTYTHFSLRLGQVNGNGAPYDNPANANQSVWIGFEDVNGQDSWHQLTGIPAPDRYTLAGPAKAQTHMNTRRIPVSAIDGIDLTDIRGIYLYFSSGTHGTLAVDSLEWHRD